MLPVPAAHSEPVELLVERLVQGDPAFLLRAAEWVSPEWLTVEQIEICARQALKEPGQVCVWPLLPKTWALTVHLPGETDSPMAALWIHSFRSDLIASLDAEWRGTAQSREALRLWPAGTREREELEESKDTGGTEEPVSPEEESEPERRLFAMFETTSAGEDAPAFTVTPISRIPALDDIQENIAELNSLLEIIVHKQLRTQFQPIAYLRDGQVFAYEALIRGPKGTLLRGGGSMLRAADKARLVAWVDIACLEQCFARAAEQNIRHPLFINMEAEGLAYLELCERSLAQCAREHGLSPASIVIEITERQAVDDFPRLLHFIAQLREQGFKIAIDDVGAGYSSLSAIAELRPEFIKIDRELVRHIDVKGPNRALLAALMQYAQQIGTQVLAEGAETRAELTTLSDLGVTFVQGYVLGKPSDDLRGVPRELREFLRQRARQQQQPLLGRPIAIGGLARAGYAVPPETPLAEVARRFARDISLTSAVVVEEGYARGLVRRDQLDHVLDMVSAANVAALLPAETVAQWMHTDMLCVEEDMPIQEVAQQVTTRTDISLDADIVIVRREGLFRGVLPTRTLLEAVLSAREREQRYAHPLTGLPGRVGLEQVLEERLAARGPLAILRADITGLSAFNRSYSLATGDTLIRALAHLLHEVSEQCGRPDDFLAHLEGDDFVLVTHPAAVTALCRALVAGFEAFPAQFYSATHLRQGYVELTDRAGGTLRAPLFRLAVAAQTNQARRLTHYAQIMGLLNEMLRSVKAQPGSRFAIDQNAERRKV